MFDPLWLASFCAVADTLNFTAAAKRLSLRQSTVSEHVRKLELACGRRLFIRDTHSVALTSHGEAMLGFASSILETNTRALRHFADDELQGRIRFGVSEDVVLKGLPQALRRFTTSHPRVELEITVGLSEALRERLDAGDLDLVFLKRRVGEIHGDLVWREPMIWLAAPDFHLDRQRPIPLIVLAPPSLTRSAALTSLERRGLRWRIVCTSGSQSGVHAAALAGLGIAPHAKSLAPEGLVETAGGALPPLGEIEFAVMGARAAMTGPVQALAAMIKANGALLRNARPQARDTYPSGGGRLGAARRVG